MPADNKKKSAKNKQNSKRRRVNFIKKVIVGGAVILLFTSVILNFVLIFKVLHLEDQINQFYSGESVTMIQDTPNL